MGQDDTRPVGPTNDRCLCIKGKYKTTEIMAHAIGIPMRKHKMHFCSHGQGRVYSYIPHGS
jgi:hypothetical protein